MEGCAGPPGDELILRTGTDKLIEQVLAPPRNGSTSEIWWRWRLDLWGSLRTMILGLSDGDCIREIVEYIQKMLDIAIVHGGSCSDVFQVAIFRNPVRWSSSHACRNHSLLEARTDIGMCYASLWNWRFSYILMFAYVWDHVGSLKASCFVPSTSPLFKLRIQPRFKSTILEWYGV